MGLVPRWQLSSFLPSPFQAPPLAGLGLNAFFHLQLLPGASGKAVHLRLGREGQGRPRRGAGWLGQGVEKQGQAEDDREGSEVKTM